MIIDVRQKQQLDRWVATVQQIFQVSLPVPTIYEEFASAKNHWQIAVNIRASVGLFVNYHSFIVSNIFQMQCLKQEIRRGMNLDDRYDTLYHSPLRILPNIEQPLSLDKAS